MGNLAFNLVNLPMRMPISLVRFNKWTAEPRGIDLAQEIKAENRLKAGLEPAFAGNWPG
jgi:hypothetical protein